MTTPPHSQQQRPVALVTGASFGVGAATALALARAGYDLAITATRVENLLKTMASLGPLGARVTVHALQLADSRSIDAGFAAALTEHGRIDVLVNNAGANLRRLAVDVTPDEWNGMMAVNVTGPFLLAQKLGRHLIETKRPGSVVNVASTHGIVGAAERTAYGISKAALIHMTKALAVEWAEHGIRVNAVAPGRMETVSPSRAGTGTDLAYMASMLARIPLHRLVTAEEVGDAIVYLAGPAASSITAHTMVLDGGLTSA